MKTIHSHTAGARRGFRPLTVRQREVLAAVVATGSAASAAEALFIERRSVEGHLDRIRRQLGLETTLQCALVAVSHGWIAAPAWHAPPAEG